MADRVRGLIAKAIKDADKSIFNEDYSKQAESVVRALGRAGYEIVPQRPSPALCEYINEHLPVGRLRPGELVGRLYTMIVDNARRLDG